MEFIKLKDEEIKRLYDLAEYGYVFDWTKKSSDKSEIVVLHRNGDILGLVEFERVDKSQVFLIWLIEVADPYKKDGATGRLLAYVAREARNLMFNAVLITEAKAYLYERYIKTFDALSISGHHLMFDKIAMQGLVTAYLEEED